MSRYQPKNDSWQQLWPAFGMFFAAFICLLLALATEGDVRIMFTFVFVVLLGIGAVIACGNRPPKVHFVQPSPAFGWQPADDGDIPMVPAADVPEMRTRPAHRDDGSDDLYVGPQPPAPPQPFNPSAFNFESLQVKDNTTDPPKPVLLYSSNDKLMCSFPQYEGLGAKVLSSFDVNQIRGVFGNNDWTFYFEDSEVFIFKFSQDDSKKLREMFAHYGIEQAVLGHVVSYARVRPYRG